MPTAAGAHGGGPEVRVILDGVAPAVGGLRVQVYDDHLAPRLELENHGDRLLEVLDDAGRAFLRIHAGGVEGDIAAAAWHRSVSPGGVPAAATTAESREGPAHWRRVRAQPAWGWFDPRLVPPAPRLAGADTAVVVAHWSVPARLDGVAMRIHGHFLYRPQPAGMLRPRMTSLAQLGPGVHVTLAPGSPPALTLENLGAHAVVVLGAGGEPFLRVSPDGVEANLASAAWQDSCRFRGQPGLPEATGGEPLWQRVSLAPRYTWLEPRASLPSLGLARVAPPDNQRVMVKAWEVPVAVGTQRTAIQGVIEWVPAGVARP